jgi:multidrug efflux system membrane fusion protein
MVLRRLHLLLVPALLAGLLAGCSNGGEERVAVRPAMVEQPIPGAAGFEAFPGDVRARHESVLSFRVGGKIAKRHVDAGAVVKKGDVLAELDPEDLRLQVAAMNAQLRAAQANLDMARGERDRYKAMFDRKLVSASVYDQQQMAYKAAEAQVGQVRAQFDVTQNQADYAKLRAPDNGVVATRLAEAGQVVAAGQPVFTLAAEGEREIAISVPESDYARFAVGQKVLVELWSQSGTRVEGRIRELSPSADPQTRTYAARVSFDAGAAKAELGQSARVYAGTGADAGLSVPLGAVTAEGNVPYVWIVDPATSQVKKSVVQLGPYGEARVPVLDGLGPQDWVVVAGVHLLREGQKVKPVDRDNRPVALAAN